MIADPERLARQVISKFASHLTLVRTGIIRLFLVVIKTGSPLKLTISRAISVHMILK